MMYVKIVENNKKHRVKIKPKKTKNKEIYDYSFKY